MLNDKARRKKLLWTINCSVFTVHTKLSDLIETCFNYEKQEHIYFSFIIF